MGFELSDEERELAKKLPCDFRPSESELKNAYSLFGEKNGIRPDIRILRGSWKRGLPEGSVPVPDLEYPELRIILDNRLCLFFFRNDGKWVFDGYECGNYEGYWTEFDWNPGGMDAPYEWR